MVDGTFGASFFDQLTKLEVGQWSGPVKSAYGLHLARVTLIESGRQPPFAEIRENVEKDWRRAKAEEYYNALLSRYEIKRPDASAVLAR